MNINKPLGQYLFVVWGQEFNLIGVNYMNSFFGHLPNFHKPLFGNQRFDNAFTPLTNGNVVDIIFGFN